MKKTLIILFIIFGVGLISSSILAGKVYYQNLQTSTKQEKKELDINALTNLYIDVAVPVDIYPTTDKPYVIFNQIFTDFIGIKPEYELQVETRSGNTYINLEQTKDLMLTLGVKENKARVSVYLPQSVINHLDIKSHVYQYNEKQSINLTGIDVNQLKVQANHQADVLLNGNYESINLNIGYGNVDITSKKPAKLVVDGDLEQNLNGQFEKVIVKNSCVGLNMQSTYAGDIYADLNNADIRLKGAYNNIELLGHDNNVDIQASTKCNLNTQGKDNIVNASGLLNQIEMQEATSHIDLKTEMIPSKLRFLSNEGNNAIKLIMPSNIPGFTVRYAKKVTGDDRNQGGYDEEEGYYGESSYCEATNDCGETGNDKYNATDENLESDFTMKNGTSDKGEVLYIYATGQIPIVLGQDRTTLKIIDGGFSSKNQ